MCAKKLYKLLVLLILSTSMPACKVQEVSGQLEVAGGRSLRFKRSSGETFSIHSGPAILRVDSHRIKRVHTMTLETSGQVLRLDFPMRATTVNSDKTKIHVTPVAGHYGADIEHAITKSPVGGLRDDSVGCTASGVCMMLVTDSNGNTSNSFGFHSDCPGAQLVKMQDYVISDGVVAKLLKSDGSVAATLVGNGPEKRTSEIVDYIGGCQT